MNTVGNFTSVTLTEKELKEILDFVNESQGSHLNQGRPDSRKMANIRQGKIAEKGFELMCTLMGVPVTPTMFENRHYGDGGKDFDLYEKTVDIKSIDSPYMSKIITGNTRELKAEVYALCLVQGLKVTLLGMISRDEIVSKGLLESDKSSEGRTYYYVHKKYLRTMKKVLLETNTIKFEKS